MTQVVTLSAPNAQDYVALAEIELCGELMIAASAAREERLSPDRIDEVLNVGDEPLGTLRAGDAGSSGGAGTGVDPGRRGTGLDDVLLGSDTEAAWTTVPRQGAHPQAAHRQSAHAQTVRPQAAPPQAAHPRAARQG
ncbi:hypothetical protein DBP15_13940 [Streptomyces sp. CS065A]|nr:hypothetical protein DBP15_13940 [Streptomyces sp. CS065A]